MMLNRLVTLACIVLYPLGGQGGQAAVEVFGPGVLSVGEVYRGSFTPDGNTFYFFKKIGSGEDYRIYSSNRSANGWTTPAVVDLGGKFSDLYPSISRDGRRIVFSSYRAVPGGQGGKPNAHLWYADRVNNRWTTPVFMARASTLGYYHSWVEFGFDDAIYFRRTTPDFKITHTMRVQWTGAEYSSPKPYVDAERWKGWRRDVIVAGGSPGPAGRLVFLDVATKNPRTGRAASDIWVSIKRGDKWTEPAPLGAGINSDGYDVFPFVSPDGRDLYFVRDFSTFHHIPLADALASIAGAPDVRYVANSGMLVTVSGRRFLIDAPIRDGIAPFATSSAEERVRLEGARAPYDNVDAILITHWHEDHFSPDAVAAHLSRNARSILISSPEVVERVRRAAPSVPASQLRAVLPAAGNFEQVDVGGVPVRVLRVRHNPTRRLPEQHVAYLIGESATVLHVGDADPAADNFALLKALPPIDLALLPFWYVLDEPNRRLVAESIRPHRIVAMHVPPGDAEKVAAKLHAANVSASLAAIPGSRLALER
jgi:L-ascorbate metabolism protein UlaG (beta-lactamase superfamily)